MNKADIESEIKVPVDLIRMSCQKGQLTPNALKVYLYLLLMRYDCRIINEQSYHDIASGLQVHVKTVRYHLKTLLKADFIGLDKVNRKHVRLISNVPIERPVGTKPNKWDVKVRIINLQNFTEHIVAAAFAYVADISKRSSRRSKSSRLYVKVHYRLFT